MQLSNLSLFFSLYIILSSIFMQQVWAILRQLLGEQILNLFLVFIFAAVVLLVISKSIKQKFELKKLCLIIVLSIAGLIFSLRQPYFSEKAHVIEFALLGWLVRRDFSKQSKSRLQKFIAAFIFVTIIGCLQEGFQKLLPWRVCELRDMITDSLSGAIGILLYTLH